MPLLFDSGPKMRRDDFRLLRDLFRDFCGIQFADEMRFVMERRLRDRLQALELDDFGDYYHYLCYHPEARVEVERAVDLLTTNETYLFREEYQLTAFQQEVLPRLQALHREDRRLTIWSAGCSTGEEVYTLGILVKDSGLFDDWQVRVVGNDISRRVLQVARRGVYGDHSFRAMPAGYEKYFEKVPGGMSVTAEIREMCHFAHLNLLDGSRFRLFGAVDAIFCRNVLIYFDASSRRRVIDAFYDRLNAGGFLFLGHSESLLNLSTAFELVHLSSDLVYQKPDGATQPTSARSSEGELGHILTESTLERLRKVGQR